MIGAGFVLLFFLSVWASNQVFHQLSAYAQRSPQHRRTALFICWVAFGSITGVMMVLVANLLVPDSWH